MKKQYVLSGGGVFQTIITLYHDGRMIKSNKYWADELDDYIDKAESEGYEEAFKDDDIEKARKKYEYLLAHKLYQTNN